MWPPLIAHSPLVQRLLAIVEHTCMGAAAAMEHLCLAACALLPFAGTCSTLSTEGRSR